MNQFVWGPAEVSFPDYQGNAQLDFRMTGESPLGLVGVDEEKWLVVGFDIGGGETSHEVRIVAVDKELFDRHDVTNIGALAERLGHIPVTEFLLHDVDPYELLKSMTHVFEMRLRARALVDQEIRVTRRGNIPEQ